MRGSQRTARTWLLRMASREQPGPRLGTPWAFVVSSHMPMTDRPRRQPMLNVPGVVIVLIAIMALIHAVLYLGLTEEQRTEFLLLFAFIPARYDASIMPDVVWPGGVAADVWTFVSYALIHGNLAHLLFNSV